MALDDLEYYEGKIKELTQKFTGIWPKIERILGFITSLLAVVTPITIFFLAKKPSDSPVIAAIITLGIISLIFAVLFFVEEIRYSSKARYAEAMYALHLCIHILRDMHYGLNDNNITNQNRRDDLSTALWSLARCFSLLKSVHCRACIKTIHFDDNIFNKDVRTLTDEERLRYLYVDTMTRDTETVKTHDFFYKQEDPRQHSIAGNSDFRELYLMAPESRRSWISNDIYSNQNYQNTRYSEIDNKKDLGYRSVLILPIRKTTKGLKYNEQKSCKQDILGFLCIDSKARGVFNNRYDTEVGALFSDALFILLKAWYQNENSKEAKDGSDKTNK